MKGFLGRICPSCCQAPWERWSLDGLSPNHQPRRPPEPRWCRAAPRAQRSSSCLQRHCAPDSETQPVESPLGAMMPGAPSEGENLPLALPVPGLPSPALPATPEPGQARRAGTAPVGDAFGARSGRPPVPSRRSRRCCPGRGPAAHLLPARRGGSGSARRSAPRSAHPPIPAPPPDPAHRLRPAPRGAALRGGDSGDSAAHPALRSPAHPACSAHPARAAHPALPVLPVPRQPSGAPVLPPRSGRRCAPRLCARERSLSCCGRMGKGVQIQGVSGACAGCCAAGSVGAGTLVAPWARWDLLGSKGLRAGQMSQGLRSLPLLTGPWSPLPTPCCRR